MRSNCCALLLVVASLCACDGSSSSGSTSASASIDSSSGASSDTNVIPVKVSAGPATANTFNIPYVSVKLCSPGSNSCATINDVLVDTGSAGLRIMASVLKAAGLTLTHMPDATLSGNTIAECLPFADGYTWGPLAKADVTLGAESAYDVSVNVINDNDSYTSAPSSCSTFGAALGSVAAFDANGILGVGVFDQDCGRVCADCGITNDCNQSGDIYYSCSSSPTAAADSSCQSTAVALPDQVRNPVAMLATDNNGVVLGLPPIPWTGVTSATGYLLLGIDTRSNNALRDATILVANERGDFTTIYNGQNLYDSFIDSGSNGLYFPDSSIPSCSTNPQSSQSRFYCPPSILRLSAINQDLNGTTSTVAFQIASLQAIGNRVYAVDDVGGGTDAIVGLSGFFDWGLPFFYGRVVFTAIEGRTAGTAVGPYYAY